VEAANGFLPLAAYCSDRMSWSEEITRRRCWGPRGWAAGLLLARLLFGNGEGIGSRTASQPVFLCHGATLLSLAPDIQTTGIMWAHFLWFVASSYLLPRSASLCEEVCLGLGRN
jgi:hypothetical protein